MGTDIHGWIECYTSDTNPESWIPVMDLFSLFPGRDYDAFACLFGVKNYVGFRPIAEDRGLPDDVSEKVREEFPVEDGYHSYTWITCREIQEIDWEEESEVTDERIHQYLRNEQGELIYHSKAAWERDFAERVGYNQVDKTLSEQEWDLGDVVYRREKLQRKEILPIWQDTFQEMERLSHIYGADNVRLIVCFDS
jgi:hypothetical protein